MPESKLREKVVNKIIGISRRFHYEPLTDELDKNQLLPKNLSLMALSYLLDSNHLIKGDPGRGKSTGARIISSVFGGVPYDLYHSLELQGHSGQVKEHVVGRLNFASLNNGYESMIWMGTIALPVLIVDEGNRLPPEVQGAILQGIESKRWNYSGNHTYYAGQKPAFITANYHDEGTEQLIPPLLDRMDIVTEERYFGRNNFVTEFTFERAEEERRRLLRDPEITNKAIEVLNKKGIDEFVRFIKSNRLKTVDPITDEEKEEIQKEIKSIKETKETKEGVNANDALLFLSAFDAEINWSEKYGSKRSVDPLSDHPHDKKYLGTHVKTGFSPRSLVATLEYAKGVAWLSGRSEIDIHDVATVLPHVIAHKMAYAEEFSSDAERKDMVEIALAKKLVKIALENYNKVAKDIKNLLAQIQADPLKAAEYDINDYDHPLQKSLIATVKDEILKFRLFGEINKEELL
ncbi:MAG: AAA family ATPase [Candidatus Micrarchaeota archaeon]|nr:AAA family ATPase [Candidatus Micrarchaeota archaeon]